MRRLALVGALVLLVLVGCSHPPNHGTVTGRHYSPAHYNDYVTYYCAAYNKGICTVNVPNFHHDYIAANWQLCLRADADDSSHDKTGCIDVPENVYDHYPSGTYYGG